MAKRFVIIDTETTGFKNWDSITQLACLILDENRKPVKATNMFLDTSKTISSEVANITKVNNQKLKVLSNGIKFGDEEMLNVFEDVFWGNPETVFVGHNISFDLRMIESNLARKGLDSLVYNGSLCTMSATKDRMDLTYVTRGGQRKKKNPNLGELYKYLKTNTKVTDKVVEDLALKIWGESMGFHDARMDTLVTMLAYLKYM